MFSPFLTHLISRGLLGFAGNQFIPHGHCYLWQQNIVWLHLISDSAIAIAYYSIPLTLLYLVKKRKDLPFDWIFLLFGGFIVSCGTTHLMEIWTLWHADYWASGVLKAVTAIISVLTAIVLVQIIPKVLEIPSTAQLKLVNQSLRHSQEQLELALEASGDGWWHWHVATGELEWSPLWASMLGYEADDLDPSYKTWEKLVHPDDFPPVVKNLNAHLQDDSIPYAFDYRVRTKSGEWKWIANLGKVVERDEQGQPVRMAGMHHDISDRKQVEEQLQQLNHELQRSNQELAQFAYVASHDLQEPLRMIKSFTDLLARRYQGQLDDKADRYMSHITNGAMRMQTLISDLLAYSRVGRLEMNVQPTDLEEIVEQVQSDLQTVIQKRQVNFEIKSLPTLSADPTQMRQLMQNLITNAIKYCNADVPMVRIWATLENHHWTVSVQDNGIGIDPEYADRIFIIFQRLHDSDTYSGTGIGLAICKKIVERHQGTIWVESQEGQGATFSFQIPVSE